MTAAEMLAWLLTYALHSTVLLGAVWLLTSHGLVRSHHLRELFWKAALVGGLLTATAQSALRQVSWGDAIALPSSRPAVMVPAAGLPMPMPLARDRAGRSGDAASAQAFPIAPALLAGWAGAAVLALLGLASAHLRLARRLGRRESIAGHPINDVLERLREDANIRRPIRLTRSDGLASPVALGHSEICLPTAALRHLDPAQQRSVLAHELAHLERHDPLWLAGACVVERVFFFQPLNRLARRRMQESAEYLCDDFAVHSTGSGLSMAKSLMKVAEWMQGEPSPVPLAGMAENRSQLVARVKRLVEHRGGVESRRRWPMPLALGLLALTAAAVPGVAATYGERQSPRLQEQTVASKPTPVVIQSVDLPELAQDAQRVAAEAVAHLDTDAIAKAALEALGEDGSTESVLDTLGVSALIAALRDSDAGVRRAAAHSLGNIESPRATEALVATLRDDDVEVRRAVAWALGNIEDRRATEALSAALRDDDPEVRKSAAWALGNIEDPRAAEPLAAALKDASAEVRKTAAWALGQLELDTAPAGLIDAMGDQDGEVRKAAVYAVGEMGDARAVPALTRMLNDAIPEVRHSAIQALGEIRDAAALQALIGAMESKDAEVRRAAADALGQR